MNPNQLISQPDMPAGGFRNGNGDVVLQGQRGYTWNRDTTYMGYTQDRIYIGQPEDIMSFLDESLMMRCVTNIMPAAVRTQPSAIPPASNNGSYILYFAESPSDSGGYANNRFLNIGRWGTKEEVENGTADVCRISQVAFFKWGGIIGLSAVLVEPFTRFDSYSTGDILFDPSNVFPTDDWATIPVQAGNNVTHTVESLRAGLGDPCRLAGLSEEQIRSALASNTLPQNARWRMPTAEEWAYFLNLPDKTDFNQAFVRGANFMQGTMDENGTIQVAFSGEDRPYWNIATLGWTGLGIAYFPNAQTPAGVAIPNAYLPTSGGRSADGGMNGTGMNAHWMSSTAYNATYVHRVHITNDDAGNSLGSTMRGTAYAVRCVPI